MKTLSIAACVAAASIACSAHALETVPLEMVGGGFSPAAITAPAGEKILLRVTNREKYETEFESYGLDREVKIAAGKSADIFVGPLKAGRYDIFDDNNADAKAVLSAQ